MLFGLQKVDAFSFVVGNIICLMGTRLGWRGSQSAGEDAFEQEDGEKDEGEDDEEEDDGVREEEEPGAGK